MSSRTLYSKESSYKRGPFNVGSFGRIAGCRTCQGLIHGHWAYLAANIGSLAPDTAPFRNGLGEV